MTTPPVMLYPDVELWLCDWLRTALARHHDGAIVVTTTLPPDTDLRSGTYYVLLRDDGGATALATETHQLGVTIIDADPGRFGAEVSELARLVKALLATTPRLQLDNPVCDVADFNGPLRIVGDNGRRTLYLTCVLTVTGQPFTTTT